MRMLLFIALLISGSSAGLCNHGMSRLATDEASCDEAGGTLFYGVHFGNPDTVFGAMQCRCTERSSDEDELREGLAAWEHAGDYMFDTAAGWHRRMQDQSWQPWQSPKPCSDYPAAFLTPPSCTCPGGKPAMIVNVGTYNQEGWGCEDDQDAIQVYPCNTYESWAAPPYCTCPHMVPARQINGVWSCDSDQEKPPAEPCSNFETHMAPPTCTCPDAAPAGLIGQGIAAHWGCANNRRRALSCMPCSAHGGGRDRPSAEELGCVGSVMDGVCPCTYQCAKQQGEKCGGMWGIQGKCEAGLHCSDTSKNWTTGKDGFDHDTWGVGGVGGFGVVDPFFPGECVSA